MIDAPAKRSMDTIDDVCRALESLGDTLAVLVSIQDITATTADGAEILSRNGQLREGQRALVRTKCEGHVVSKKLRETFNAMQGDGAKI